MNIFVLKGGVFLSVNRSVLTKVTLFFRECNILQLTSVLGVLTKIVLLPPLDGLGGQR